eukprot:GDKJ01017432.1.p1 GENE.GDKJ01017432.1~~GDKJ01017432.1.p1  ORF type:complete len:1456 (-),score=425.96 GDKJ01017432.1:50-4213(-)
MKLENSKYFEVQKSNISHSALTLLDKFNLLRYNRATGFIAPTTIGRIAASFYLKYQTVAAFNDHLRPQMHELEIVKTFTLAQEFKLVPVRPEEKVELARLVERVPLPIKGAADDCSAKIAVLLQAYISRLKLDGFALMADLVYVTQSGLRLFRAIFELALSKGWSSLAVKSLNLCKAIQHRQWSSSSPLRQMGGVDEEILRRLEKREISLDKLALLNHAELGELLRMPKQGRKVQELISKFPRLQAEAFVKPLSRGLLEVNVEIKTSFTWDDELHGYNRGMLFHIFAEDGDQEVILYKSQFLIYKNTETLSLRLTIPLTDPLHPVYFLRLVSDYWQGVETVVPVAMRDLILPAKPFPFTQVQDVESLPLRVIKWKEVEGSIPAAVVYGEGKERENFKLNNIQSQVYPAVYESDDSVLLCSQEGTGKRFILLLALLRFLKFKLGVAAPPSSEGGSNLHEGKVLILTGTKAAAIEMEKMISRAIAPLIEKNPEQFLQPLLLTQVTSSAEVNVIVKKVGQSAIIIADGVTWETVSRRWRSRKTLQSFSLLLVQGLSVIEGVNKDIGDHMGASLEVAVSRSRFVNAQLKRQLRIVATAPSTSNANDIADWLGVKATGSIPRLFTFAPQVRGGVSALDVIIKGYDHLSRGARLFSMTRAAYEHAKEGTQTILVVPDRAVARDAARDLLEICKSRKTLNKYLSCHPSCEQAVALALKPNAARMTLEAKMTALEDTFALLQSASSTGKSVKASLFARERTLLSTAARGIVYIHEGMSLEERNMIENLYRSGEVGLLVVPQTMMSTSCSSLNRTNLANDLTATQIILLETTFVDPATGEETVYPLRDVVLSALSRASTSSSASLCRRDNARAEGIVLTSTTHEKWWRSVLLNISQFSATNQPQNSHSDHKDSRESNNHQNSSNIIINSAVAESAPPLESSLEDYLPDILNAEINAKTISNFGEALDWLTWTYLYRRVPKNPNFYGLLALSHSAFSEHLSGLVETAMETLESSSCISVSNDSKSDTPCVSPLNMGIIASHYNISIHTISLLASSDGDILAKRRSLVSLLVSTPEVARVLPVRTGENFALKKLARLLGADAPEDASVLGSFVAWKAMCLFHAYLHRIALPNDWKNDLAVLLPVITQLLVGLVDIAASKSIWKAARAVMDMHQFAMTATLPTTSSLLQAPFISDAIAQNLEAKGVKTILSILDMEDADRETCFSSLTEKEMEELANFCNYFPAIGIVSLRMVSKNEDGDEIDELLIGGGKKQTQPLKVKKSGEVEIQIVFNRDEESIQIFTPPFAEKPAVGVLRPHLPSLNGDCPLGHEHWWLCAKVGENELASITRLEIFGGRGEAELNFEVGDERRLGQTDVTVNLVCDSFRNADETLSFTVEVIA